MSSLGDSIRQAKESASAGSKLPPPLPPPSFLTEKAPAPTGDSVLAGTPAFRSRYFDEGELARYEDLLIFATTTVEGFLAGKHRSPHFGFSAEFVEHKPYTPGDEIAHIDWQVYARSKKLFTRKFLEETDMTIHLLVDCSPSMAFNGRRREMKQARAKRVAAALAYLMLKQGDKAALGLFSDRLVNHVPPGSTRRHLFRLLTTLEQTVSATPRTDTARALTEAAAQMRKRGRLVVISDFLGIDVEAMFNALSLFVHRGFEVMLIQVLEPEELTLPDVSVARFQDMETREEVQVEPEEIRAAYMRTVQEHIDSLRAQALRRRITFSTYQTAAPYIDVIENYMGFRHR